MKKTLILAIVATASLAWAGDSPTMADLESQFADKVIALSQATNVPPHMMEQEILKAAASVFSNHTDVVSQETEKRLAELPTFKASDIPSATASHEFDLSVVSVPQLKQFLIAFGWQPKRVAQTAKGAALSRHMGVEQFGRRALLEAALPDRYYRLEDSTKPIIVIESLGDLFIVECRKHEWGVLMPEKMRWLMKKESRTTPRTVP